MQSGNQISAISDKEQLRLLQESNKPEDLRTLYESARDHVKLQFLSENKKMRDRLNPGIEQLLADIDTHKVKVLVQADLKDLLAATSREMKKELYENLLGGGTAISQDPEATTEEKMLTEEVFSKVLPTIIDLLANQPITQPAESATEEAPAEMPGLQQALARRSGQPQEIRREIPSSSAPVSEEAATSPIQTPIQQLLMEEAPQLPQEEIYQIPSFGQTIWNRLFALFSSKPAEEPFSNLPESRQLLSLHAAKKDRHTVALYKQASDSVRLQFLSENSNPKLTKKLRPTVEELLQDIDTQKMEILSKADLNRLLFGTSMQFKKSLYETLEAKMQELHHKEHATPDEKDIANEIRLRVNPIIKNLIRKDSQ